MPLQICCSPEGPCSPEPASPLHGHAVAVTGGRITAIVPEAEAARARRRARPAWSQLDGALLSPGFQDAHIHPVGAGVELLQCNLTEADGCRRHGRDASRAYADANPDEPWILGGGWSMDHYPGGAPLRGLLDAVVPDRPVLLLSRDHHSAWANTAAIRLAGIDASTPDPVDGRIEREADGSPAGTFHEGASDLFDGVRPPIDPDLAYAGPAPRAERAARARHHRLAGRDGRRLDRRHRRPARRVPPGARRGHAARARRRRAVVGADRRHRAGRRHDRAPRRGRGARREDRLLARHRRRSWSTAWPRTRPPRCSTPYRDAHGHDTDNRGLSFVDPERCCRDTSPRSTRPASRCTSTRSATARCARRSTRSTPPREANGATDGRHHLAHLQVVDEAGRARFAELDAVANIQALWATPRGPDRRAHPAVPAATAPRPGSTRSATSSRARRAPRRRQRLARVERRPDGRDPHRRQPGRARDRRRAARRRAPAPRPRDGAWPRTRPAPPT